MTQQVSTDRVAAERVDSQPDQLSRSSAVIVHTAAAAGLVCAAGLILAPAHTVLWVAPCVLAFGLLLMLSMPVRWVPAVATTGICLEIVSGNWSLLHIPVAPDRPIVVLAAAVAVRHALSTGQTLVRFRPLLWVFALLLAWTTVSAAMAGTLTTTYGFYALVDRQGILPVLVFALAPLLFPDAHARRVLLFGVTITGTYLAYVAFCEGLELKYLVLPRFIVDPNVGIQADRARGPFLESVAMGLALMMCGTLAAVLASGAQEKLRIRLWAVIVAVTCLLGTVFTLTRSVWVGSAVAIVVVTVVHPPLRKRAFLGLPLAAIAVVALLVFVPGLAGKTSARTNAERPVQDRQNVAAAAERIVSEHPLFGVGWLKFVDVGSAYVRQADTYPITNVHIEVHNVPLARAAELGLPGAALWGLSYLGVTLWPLRRAAARHTSWGVALLACSICYLIVANLGPLGYAFPTLILWLLGGLVTGDGDSPQKS